MSWRHDYRSHVHYATMVTPTCLHPCCHSATLYKIAGVLLHDFSFLHLLWPSQHHSPGDCRVHWIWLLWHLSSWRATPKFPTRSAKLSTWTTKSANHFESADSQFYCMMHDYHCKRPFDLRWWLSKDSCRANVPSLVAVLTLDWWLQMTADFTICSANRLW